MYFFQYGAENKFYTFDLVHIIVLLISFGLIGYMLSKRQLIADSSKSQKIGYYIGGVLLFLDFSFYVWKWINGAQEHFPIPMHLCSWATYIVAMSFFIKNKTLFHFAFYYGTIGGLLSLLVPEFGGYSWNHMRFYQFFLLHLIILAGPMYQYYVYKFKLDYKKMAPIVLGAMYVQAIIADFINDYFTSINENGTVSNMLFTNSPPIPLGDGLLSNPIVYLLIFGIIFMIVWIILVKLMEYLKVEN